MESDNCRVKWFLKNFFYEFCEGQTFKGVHLDKKQLMQNILQILAQLMKFEEIVIVVPSIRIFL